jgi:ATP-dependent DNA helicase RecQ
MTMDRLKDLVRNIWGYDDFLPLQEQAIQSVLSNQDSLVVLPTGGGKSLCFQAPALCMEGVAFVVSPLIALMKDQVDALRARGLPAGCLNSLSTPNERQDLANLFRSGKLKLLYVAPERLLTEPFLAFLGRTKVSFFAIDEAHCISTWGHDFRPDYRDLRILKERFPRTPVHAYTATATPQVREDIITQLGLVSPEVLVGPFDRPNLIYRNVHRKKEYTQILAILERHPGESGIIYCLSRQKTEDLTASLQEDGYSVAAYHAGLSDEDRKRNQDAFIREEVSTIVATVAFGMGIDKPNVRYVIHLGMPKSLESYQQESGRAGRDGLPAECWLLFSLGDLIGWKKRTMESDPDRLRIAFKKFEDMYAYCTGTLCRHRAILRYFGQDIRRYGCGSCDICLGFEDLKRARRKREPRKEGTLTASRIKAFELFSRKCSLDEVMELAGRARSTVCQYLVEYLTRENIHEPYPWVSPVSFGRVREVVIKAQTCRLTTLHTLLSDEISYEDIRFSVACLRNHDS